MQLTTLVTASILAFTVTSTTALPQDPPSSAPIAEGVLTIVPTDLSSLEDASPDTITKRGNGDKRKITYCQDQFGHGKCKTDYLRERQCYNVDGWWNDRISSFYPSWGTYCYVYDRANCNAAYNAAMIVDAKWGLRNIGMNDKISSIKCLKGF